MERVITQRAAILARCSTEANVCSQILTLKQFAKDKYIIGDEDVFGDNISGSSSITERPELAKLMNHIENGTKHYDVVLVQDTSRIGKTPEQVQKLVDWFMSKNVRVEFLDS